MRITSDSLISRRASIPSSLAWIVLVIVIVFVAMSGAVSSSSVAIAAPVERSLLAHGSDDEMWIVDVSAVPPSDRDADDSSPAGAQSMILGRPPKNDRAAGAPPRGEWVSYTTVPARVVALGNRSSQLIALLDNGQWMLAWYHGSTLGRALPNGKIVAITADERTMWAVGAVPGGMPATEAATRPAASPPTTSPVTATTDATAEAPALVLFSFQQDGWTPHAELPADLPLDAPLSMTVIDNRPVVGALVGDRQVAIVRFGEQETWDERELVESPAEIAIVKLLQLRKRLGIWVSTADGQDLLYQRAKNRSKWDTTTLKTADPVPPEAERALAVSGERVRLLYSRLGKVLAQRYELSGEPVDAPVEVTLPDPAAMMTVAQWLNLLLTLLLMLVMFATVRQRKNLRSAMLEAGKLSLAPLLPRFLAGFIDASPVLVTIVVTFAKYAPDPADPDASAALLRWPLVIATGVYVLHTMVLELLTQRSIGKILFGLRVVTLEGNRPPAVAIILRNLLRVIDLFLFFPVMLVLIFFSPLRQRAGDIAAGTLVVTNQREEEKPDAREG